MTGWQEAGFGLGCLWLQSRKLAMNITMQTMMRSLNPVRSRRVRKRVLKLVQPFLAIRGSVNTFGGRDRNQKENQTESKATHEKDTRVPERLTALVLLNAMNVSNSVANRISTLKVRVFAIKCCKIVQRDNRKGSHLPTNRKM